MNKFVRSHPMITGVLLILLLLITIILWLSVKPVELNEVITSTPAVNYEEALTRIEAIQAAEVADEDLNPVCYSKLLTHGEVTDKAVVFLHGFTSCPEQFEQLGEAFFNQGYNVYIPRMPGHGYNDRLGEALKGVTPQDMGTFAMQSADLAQGLGDHVTVSGLSGGGALTVWLAQERADIDLAAPMAPFLGVGFVPTALNKPFANLLYHLPDFFQWWDPVHKSGNPLTAPYAYVRYPIHAMDDFLILGFSAQRSARNAPPAAGAIVMITNAADSSVNNPINEQIVSIWGEHGGIQIDTYEFPPELELPHDMITPTRPGNQVDLVYPVLMELLQAQKSDKSTAE